MDPVLSGASFVSANDTTAPDATNLINASIDSASSTAASPTPAASASSTTTATLPSIPATLPRDCRDLIALLQSMNLAYHPSILPLLLDHYQQLTAALLTHLATTTQHTHRTPADTADLTATIASFAATSTAAPTLPPPIELMLPLAVQRNAVPLPLLRLQREKGEVMLPPDRFLLTHRSWQAEVGESTRRRQTAMEDGSSEERAAAVVNGNGATVS